MFDSFEKATVRFVQREKAYDEGNKDSAHEFTLTYAFHVRANGRTYKYIAPVDMHRIGEGAYLAAVKFYHAPHRHLVDRYRRGLNHGAPLAVLAHVVAVCHDVGARYPRVSYCFMGVTRRPVSGIVEAVKENIRFRIYKYLVLSGTFDDFRHFEDEGISGYLLLSKHTEYGMQDALDALARTYPEFSL